MTTVDRETRIAQIMGLLLAASHADGVSPSHADVAVWRTYAEAHADSYA